MTQHSERKETGWRKPLNDIAASSFIALYIFSSIYSENTAEKINLNKKYFSKNKTHAHMHIAKRYLELYSINVLF